MTRVIGRWDQYGGWDLAFRPLPGRRDTPQASADSLVSRLQAGYDTQNLKRDQAPINCTLFRGTVIT